LNFAIFRKTLRDTAAMLLMASLGTIGFVVLFIWAMQTLGPELMTFVSKFDFLKRILEVSLGVSMKGEISPNIMYAVSFTHLVVLIAGWGPIITVITRVTVGEEEQGTADLLLSLPVRRTTVWISTTLVWVLVAAVLATSPLVGVGVGTRVFPTEEIVHLTRYISASVNLFALHLAIGGMTAMFACVSGRRGRAIALVIAVALLSATLNFIDPFLPMIQRFNFLGLLHYYRPVDIVRESAWPWFNIFALAGFGFLTWLVGMIVYCRKDVPVA
jgi:ABC-2 type transport system permease protein